MNNLRRLDLNLLVTLDALLAEHNVTRAAQRLNFSQPAVSVHLAKLRAIFDDPLLLPGPRGMRPTARAEQLREPLRQALAEEALDLALLWQTEDQGSGLGLCPLAWIAHPDLDIRALLVSGEPLPLVMFDSPCLMRSRAIACLDAAGIPWQVVFVSHSLSGIWAAVQAGLGLTIRTRIGMPGNLRPAGGLLPAPGSLAVSLRQTPREESHSAAVALLGELMTEALQGWLDR